MSWPTNDGGVRHAAGIASGMHETASRYIASLTARSRSLRPPTERRSTCTESSSRSSTKGIGSSDIPCFAAPTSCSIRVITPKTRSTNSRVPRVSTIACSAGERRTRFIPQMPIRLYSTSFGSLSSSSIASSAVCAEWTAIWPMTYTRTSPLSRIFGRRTPRPVEPCLRWKSFSITKRSRSTSSRSSAAASPPWTSDGRITWSISEPPLASFSSAAATAFSPKSAAFSCHHSPSVGAPRIVTGSGAPPHSSRSTPHSAAREIFSSYAWSVRRRRSRPSFLPPSSALPFFFPSFDTSMCACQNGSGARETMRAITCVAAAVISGALPSTHPDSSSAIGLSFSKIGAVADESSGLEQSIWRTASSMLWRRQRRTSGELNGGLCRQASCLNRSTNGPTDGPHSERIVSRCVPTR